MLNCFHSSLVNLWNRTAVWRARSTSFSLFWLFFFFLLHLFYFLELSFLGHFGPSSFCCFRFLLIFIFLNFFPAFSTPLNTSQLLSTKIFLKLRWRIQILQHKLKLIKVSNLNSFVMMKKVLVKFYFLGVEFNFALVKLFNRIKFSFTSLLQLEISYSLDISKVLYWCLFFW